MIIYFDESYDRPHRYLLLGTLYVPGSRGFHRRLLAIKNRHRATAPGHTFSDMKYSRAGDRYVSAACRDAVDLFVQSNCFFRCVVVDTQMPAFSWSYFGGPATPGALRKAYAYNKFAERLLSFNLGTISRAVLLADWLTRTPGNNFVQYVGITFGPTVGPNLTQVHPRIRHVQQVDTRLEQYQVGQVCDILLGVVLGDLVPPLNPNKLALISHTKTALRISSFGPGFWRRYPKYILDTKFPKFQVWHWCP